MLNKHKNPWQIATILLITTSVLLAGATVYFATRSINSAERNDNASINVGQPKTEETVECPEEVAITPPEASETDYLVVKEWGIRFKRPTGITELSYTISDNELTFMGLLSAKYWNSPAQVPDFKFDSAIDREMVVLRNPENNDPLKNCQASCPMAVRSVGGYNYYLLRPQGSNSYTSELQEIQAGIAYYNLAFMINTFE
jgi:hypothetical protein